MNSSEGAPLTSEAQTLFAAWRIAEALLAADCALEAIQILDGALVEQLSVTMAREEVLTRIRLAEIVLEETQNPEVARRALEPCVRHFTNHSVTPADRAAVLRLLCVAARRRGQFGTALQYLSKCGTVVADQSQLSPRTARGAQHGTSAVASSQRAEIAVEYARIYFAQALQSNFTDVTAISNLSQVAQQYVKFAEAAETTPHSITLALCFVMATYLCGDVDAALEHLRQSIALFGPRAEFVILQKTLDLCFGRGLPTAVGGTGIESSPNGGLATAEVAAEVTWLSKACVDALHGLLELISFSMTAKHDNCVAKFNELIDAVEWQMKILTAAHPAVSASRSPIADGGSPGVASVGTRSSASTPDQVRLNGANSISSTHAEMRCLVGIKVTAYMQVALMDITKLDICGAAAKVEPLCSYITMFHRHTAHFRADLHVLIAALCVAVQQPHDAIAHADVAISCADPVAGLAAAQLVRALALCASRQESAQSQQLFADAVDQLYAVLESEQPPATRSATRANIAASQQSIAVGSGLAAPRFRLIVDVLQGLRYLDQYDHPRAIAVLKRAADEAKQLFGVSNPIVGQCLRLVAAGQQMAGNTSASDAALTTATQLGEKAHDELSLIHCLAFSLKHLVVLNEKDRSRQRQLHKSFEDSMSHYTSQIAAAMKMREMTFIVGFLPGNPDYDRWMEKVSAVSTTAPSSGAAATTGPFGTTPARRTSIGVRGPLAK